MFKIKYLNKETKITGVKYLTEDLAERSMDIWIDLKISGS